MDRQRMFGFVTRGLSVVLLLAGAVGVRAESVEKLPGKPAGYVSDFAGVLDAGSEAQMEALCTQVDRQAHAQIAVVTIRSLDGEAIEDFASKLEEKWKVGAKGTDRGVLMLFAINDHKQRIEVGYGLEGILNDAKVGDIARSMRPQLSQSQYGQGILGGLQQLSNVIAKDAGVAITQPQDDGTPRVVQTQRHGSNAGSVLRILFFLFVLFMIFKGGGRGGGSGWLWFLAGNMMGGGGGGRDRDDGGGGGGFGGFGGGSSGGGGASSDW